MLSWLVAGAVLVSGVFAQDFTVDTPTAVHCQLTAINWHGGISPYTLSINSPSDPSDVLNPVNDFRIDNTEFFWDVDAFAGTSLIADVTDSTGRSIQSAPFIVQPSNSSCPVISIPPLSSTTSTSATSTSTTSSTTSTSTSSSTTTATPTIRPPSPTTSTSSSSSTTSPTSTTSSTPSIRATSSSSQTDGFPASSSASETGSTTTSTDASAPASTAQVQPEHHASRTGLIAGVASGIAALAIALVCALLAYIRRRNRLPLHVEDPPSENSEVKPPSVHDLASIFRAAERRTPSLASTPPLLPQIVRYPSTDAISHVVSIPSSPLVPMVARYPAVDETPRSSSSLALRSVKSTERLAREPWSGESVGGDTASGRTSEVMDSEGHQRWQGEVAQLRAQVALIENILQRRADGGPEQSNTPQEPVRRSEGDTRIHTPPPEYSSN